MSDTYKLRCHGCGRTIELPAAGGQQVSECSNCGAKLVIEWRAEGDVKAKAR